MDFNKLNEIGSLKNMKPYKKITELEINKEFKLIDIKATKTRFGRKIIAECEDFIIYLPARFDVINDDQIIHLQKSVAEWSIKCTGKEDYSLGKQATTLQFVKIV